MAEHELPPAQEPRRVRIELELPDGSSMVYEGRAATYSIETAYALRGEAMVLTVEWVEMTAGVAAVTGD